MACSAEQGRQPVLSLNDVKLTHAASNYQRATETKGVAYRKESKNRLQHRLGPTSLVYRTRQVWDRFHRTGNEARYASHVKSELWAAYDAFGFRYGQSELKTTLTTKTVDIRKCCSCCGCFSESTAEGDRCPRSVNSVLPKPLPDQARRRWRKSMVRCSLVVFPGWCSVKFNLSCVRRCCQKANRPRPSLVQLRHLIQAVV